MTSTRRFLLAGVVIAGAAVIGYMVFNPGAAQRPRSDSTQTAPRTRPVPVLVASVEQRAFNVDLKIIGSVQPTATVAVKSRVDGQLMAAHFSEGQFVKKGAKLFTLDARPFEAMLRQTEATLARDRAQLVRARDDLARYTDLMKREFSSRQKVEESAANAAALEATVRAGEATVEMAKLQLEYTAIVSPIDGRTGSLMINPGNLVKANDSAPIVVINQIRPIYVSFAVAEKYLPEIRRRMASGPITVGAVIPVEPDQPEKGRISFINNTVDLATGTITLKAVYDNDNDRLVPGQFVNVTLTLLTIPDAVIVPAQAVQTNQDGNYAFVVKPDMTVEQRPIVVGPSSDGSTVVTRGLAATERVVIEGQLRLVAGSRVDIRQSEQPASGS